MFNHLWDLTLNFDLDTVGYVKENNINARKKVQELMETLDFVDTWRCSHPNDEKFSWFSTESLLKCLGWIFFLYLLIFM